MKTSKRILIHFLLAASILFVVNNAYADLKFDFSSTGGYTENLLNDSSAITDSYSMLRASVNYYPVSKLEINFNNNYTYYGKTIDLSNFIGGVGIRFIPTSQNSPLSVLISGSFSSQSYRDSYSQFNTDNYEFGISVGAPLIPSRLQMRYGIGYSSVIYTNFNFIGTDIGIDKKTVKLFLGINATLPGPISLDVETGYASMDYKKIRDTLRYFAVDPVWSPIDSSWADTELKSFYISPRLSRQIGSKIGLSLSYTYRDFSNFDNRTVWGIATGFISPWSSIYDGQTITASIKTYLIPSFITSVGVGYWDKTFFTTADNGIFRKDLLKIRRDYQSRYYISLQHPFALSSGTVIEPSFQLEYSDNRSTHGLYNYNMTSVSAGINIRL